MSHPRSRVFLYAVGGAGIVSAAGCIDGAQRSATKIDHRRARWRARSRVVRRFARAWSDNIGAAELPAFFPDDAVYHNIPLAPVPQGAIANNIASFIRPGAPGIEGIQFRVITSQPMSGRDDRAGGRLQAP